MLRISILEERGRIALLRQLGLVKSVSWSFSTVNSPASSARPPASNTVSGAPFSRRRSTHPFSDYLDGVNLYDKILKIFRPPTNKALAEGPTIVQGVQHTMRKENVAGVGIDVDDEGELDAAADVMAGPL